MKEPVLQDDFVTCYTFNADKTYEVYTGSPLSNGVPFRGTYIISLDEKLIKLYDKEEHCTEQYHIFETDVQGDEVGERIAQRREF